MADAAHARYPGGKKGAPIAHAKLIERLPFACLEDVLAFELSSGRPKDPAHSRLIEKHLLGDGAP